MSVGTVQTVFAGIFNLQINSRMEKENSEKCLHIVHIFVKI